ncbi:MAG: A/G-specific adenine glycosylase [Gammaproteobacteria bacterium]|nr:A/G-specific adenine glycosylase [Gammaproteobacteria bacterium]
MAANETSFTLQVLTWFDIHGRRRLPWHANRAPYRIWVSEIMLQQTQVTTVIPYYERFIARFPDMSTLAHANIDEVLHLWTGLGYYARARNLHRAACLIVDEQRGVFPKELDQVQQLPGIGKSTAGAILAFAFGQRHAILDGNVKRVLTRYYRISGPPSERLIEKQLWQLAERNTPCTRIADYTQAIMDLGAMVCRRKQPTCPSCPLSVACLAHKHGDQEAYPTPRPRKVRPKKQTTMLMVRNRAGHVLLQRRPPSGIWGGLWSFPECQHPDLKHWCAQQLGIEIEVESPWRTIAHSFTHFDLNITPVPARLAATNDKIMEPDDSLWYNPRNPEMLGLAAPVKLLLDALENPL